MELKKFVDLGVQSFEKLRQRDSFYIDKTAFIKEWWEYGADVTLVTRPRRFGKTLNMDMLNCFFSNQYADENGKGNIIDNTIGNALFEGLSVWEEEKYRQLQGTYPVIFLSFAAVKTGNVGEIKTIIKQIITDAYRKAFGTVKDGWFSENDRKYIASVNQGMDDATAMMSINRLCRFLEEYYGKKVIVLLDEYDTPMQEAWLAGNWDETVQFFRLFFNATFKTNFSLCRALITGITRISKESVFSDFNNLEVITSTSDKYATCFGFTENEVFSALEAMGLGEQKQGVKAWYDGFCIGAHTDIYNPWSIAAFLNGGGKYQPYWANTSSNALVNRLVQTGSTAMKQTMEELLAGGSFRAQIDEQIAFGQMEEDENAVWSLFLAAGYLKIVGMDPMTEERMELPYYTLMLTNREVLVMFKGMIRGWFGTGTASSAYNGFVKALLLDDVEYMNEFMNKIALQSFSSFDLAKNASPQDDPERFYHGFVLGLMVGLEGRFMIRSNRESGFGRYDIVLIPKDKSRDNAYIIEFKVHKPKQEKNLEETVANAHRQIEEKKYGVELLAAGCEEGKIRKYGFAFEGKHCLIG